MVCQVTCIIVKSHLIPILNVPVSSDKEIEIPRLSQSPVRFDLSLRSHNQGRLKPGFNANKPSYSTLPPI